MRRLLFSFIALLFSCGVAFAQSNVIVNYKSSATDATQVSSTNPLPVSLSGIGGTQPVSIADGADVTLGAKADTAWVSGSGSAIAILKTIAGNSGGSIPAGAAIIGKVGIDQTTPGTTNGIVIAPSSAAGIGILPTVSTAAESCRVLKSGTGNLYTLTTVIGATSGYILAFDATSAPGDGAVTPKWWFPINSNGTNGAAAASWTPGPPLNFSVGITVCFSSTGPFTKTASSTASFSAQVQ